MNKEVVDGSPPSLEFYYDVNLSKKTVTFSNEDLETRISQNTIFLDKELTIPIGNYILDFVFGKNVDVDVATFSVTFVNYTNLRGGFRGSSTNNPKNNAGTIVPNNYITYNIYSGEESFLGVSGFMVILTDSTPIRHVLVYFAK